MLRGPCAQWATTGAPDAHATRNQTRSAPCTRTTHGVGERRWWVAGTTRGGAGHLGLTHTGMPRECSKAGCGQPEDGGVWTAKTVKRPPQQPAQPQYANYWALLTRKRHILPHPSQSEHANHWGPRTRKQHQQEHLPQRPTESSDPTQHAKGRTGDRPGPRKETATRRNVTQGGREGGHESEAEGLCECHEFQLRKLLGALHA